MSYAVLGQGNNPSSYLTRYQINTEAELDDVPKHPDCAYGSTVLCLSNGKMYRLGTDNVYYAVSRGGGSGSEEGKYTTEDDIDAMFGNN